MKEGNVRQDAVVITQDNKNTDKKRGWFPDFLLRCARQADDVIK